MTFQAEPKPTFESVRQQILDWRVEHKAPIAFPAIIWDYAVQLAKEFGCGPTARALKLDYGCLKRRSGIEVTARAKSKGGEQPLFFELFQSPANAFGNCTVLLDTNRGSKIRIEFASIAPASLAAFVKDLGA